MQSSTIIPVNNISVLFVSTVIALYFFKEKMTLQKLLGVILSIIAILLITFSEYHGGS
jgi:uncharacterized membrane protein